LKQSVGAVQELPANPRQPGFAPFKPMAHSSPEAQLPPSGQAANRHSPGPPSVCWLQIPEQQSEFALQKGGAPTQQAQEPLELHDERQSASAEQALPGRPRHA
jgi:hypothetical protein